MNKIQFKAIVLILPFIFFSGCGEKKEKSEHKIKEVKVNSSPTIEIIQNDNISEIKVKEKEKTNLKVKDGKAYYYDYNVNSAYDENAQPANKDASVRVRPRTVVEAYSHIRSPYERVQVSLIAQQLSSQFRLKCSACHDDYANGVLGPSLLGKDGTYIYNKIIEFKTGVKSNPLMNDLIKQMSNKEIKRLADEIYEFNVQVQNLRGKK